MEAYITIAYYKRVNATQGYFFAQGLCPIFSSCGGKNKKQLRDNWAQKCRRKTAECSQYVTTIAELNKKILSIKKN